jgi:hypothetical protein
MQHNGVVPPSNDPAVKTFISKWQLSATPTLLQYKDYGYEAAWCHVSAKHKAISAGGRRVHGWALWLFEGLLLADHHSVWETQKGDLVDVTPPSNGGDTILFVRDDTARIELENGAILLFTQRTVNMTTHWFWEGNPSEYSNWPCPQNKQDIVAYCAELKIPVSEILTDDQYG